MRNREEPVKETTLSSTIPAANVVGILSKVRLPCKDFLSKEEGVMLVDHTLDERDLFHSEAVNGPWAFSGTMDPELDRYLDTLQLIPDRGQAYKVWQAYQHRLLRIQPYTFLYSAFRRDGVNKRLRGVAMDTRGDWATIRQWWIPLQERRVR